MLGTHRDICTCIISGHKSAKLASLNQQLGKKKGAWNIVNPTELKYTSCTMQLPPGKGILPRLKAYG